MFPKSLSKKEAYSTKRLQEISVDEFRYYLLGTNIEQHQNIFRLVISRLDE